MKQVWEQEKQAIDAIRSLKEELEHLRTQVERETDLAAAAEIRYGRIPELERRIEEATDAPRLDPGERARCSRRRSTPRTSPRSSPRRPASR